VPRRFLSSFLSKFLRRGLNVQNKSRDKAILRAERARDFLFFTTPFSQQQPSASSFFSGELISQRLPRCEECSLLNIHGGNYLHAQTSCRS